MPGDTLNVNNKAKKQNTYDAIIVGSGITGGWAAKELCEKGLKVKQRLRQRFNFETDFHVEEFLTKLS